jgi:tetratricopeptide (TPR) repeat protein
VSIMKNDPADVPNSGDPLTVTNGTRDPEKPARAQQLAAQSGEWRAVIELSDELRSLNYNSARVYSEHFDALLHLGRLAEAEVLLREGLENYPKAHQVTFKWARLATIQRNYEVAAQRWLDVLGDQSKIEERYVSAAYCLQTSGNIAAASILLEKQ